MALGGFGVNVDERTIEANARLEDEGTRIDELERLARAFGLRAEIEYTTVVDPERILARLRRAT